MSKKVNKQGIDPKVREQALAYKQCFGTESGEKVLKHLEVLCQVRNTSFVKTDEFTPADPLEMAFKEGMKKIYWHVRKYIDLDLT